MPRILAVPEDFRVDEIPLYEPEGVGEHTFVRLEKRLHTTEDAARALARHAGVAPRDVGYAGRKDRVAVTTQWFSVPRLDPERARAFEAPGMRVLEAARHPHKLRTGHLRGNRFRVVVRGLDAAAAAAAEERLAELCARGMPNRFGAQRFGRDGANPERALALLRGEERPRGRRAARFLLSSLQAAVFNDALAAREAPLDEVERGDVAVVHRSGGLFLVEDVASEAPRAAAFEISATGPIFGSRVLEPEGRPAEREREARARRGVRPEDVATRRPLRGIELRGSRRALRVRPQDASIAAVADGDDAFALRFTLPSGAYATVLVEELLGPVNTSPSGVCWAPSTEESDR